MLCTCRLQAWALAVMRGGLPDDVLAAVQAALRALVREQPSEAGLLLLLDALLLTAAYQWQRQHPGRPPAHLGEGLHCAA